MSSIPMASSGSRDTVPGPAAPAQPGSRTALLRAADGVPIEAAYVPGPGPGAPAIVVAHGFTGALERPAIRRAAAVFAQRAGVVTFSFRGHGGSGGRSTVGDREVLDLAAAVAWARSLGHGRVATVGFSMGGSVVLRHGALYRGGARGDGRERGGREGRTGAYGNAVAGRGAGAGGWGTEGPGADGPALGLGADGPGADGPVALGSGTDGSVALGADALGAGAVPTGTVPYADAVVSVSSPARWYYRGTAPMRRLHWVVERRTGRAVSRLVLKTRIHHRRWNPVPLSPTAAVPLIAPAPLLIVHGTQDGYFPLDHPHALAAAAEPGGAELWLEEDFGHAENAASDGLLERIATWAAEAVSGCSP
ncbi:alpha/beta fold hydrolase [Streptomyces sp. WMMC500]|uniref:alpha/beta hydrolase family protein n=1 Tax=Streptomyces sp. WMMC500 TaxID=3015154 RepID=UPI00248AD171|nr:alpha/beta fold hydrolase [Streptomyces sp. WMMC500]WBB58427.1 alpha/beta fold hydrolase [Streptomyces sp. WMMC500]